MTTPDPSSLTWAELCELHPNEWVLLTGLEEASRSARVPDHDGSSLTLLDRNAIVPGATLIHTAGRPLCMTPRIVMTDEIRELLRAPKQLVVIQKSRR